MKKSGSKLELSTETIKHLSDKETGRAKGGGMCSTAAPTGTCPTQSQSCPVTK